MCVHFLLSSLFSFFPQLRSANTRVLANRTDAVLKLHAIQSRPDAIWWSRPIRLQLRLGARFCAKAGTRFDAMVVVQLVLGLVEPQSSGLGGGGGFLVYWDAHRKQLTTLDDGREIAPRSQRIGCRMRLQLARLRWACRVSPGCWSMHTANGESSPGPICSTSQFNWPRTVFKFLLSLPSWSMKIRSFYRAFHQAALISSVERRLPKARNSRTGITGGRSPGYAIEEPNRSIPEGLPLLLSRKCATHSNLARPARQVNLASPGNLANREKVASPGNLASPETRPTGQ